MQQLLDKTHNICFSLWAWVKGQEFARNPEAFTCTHSVYRNERGWVRARWMCVFWDSACNGHVNAWHGCAANGSRRTILIMQCNHCNVITSYSNLTLLITIVVLLSLSLSPSLSDMTARAQVNTYCIRLFRFIPQNYTMFYNINIAQWGICMYVNAILIEEWCVQWGFFSSIFS